MLLLGLMLHDDEISGKMDYRSLYLLKAKTFIYLNYVKERNLKKQILNK